MPVRHFAALKGHALLLELPAFHDRQLIAAVIILILRVVSPQDFRPVGAPDLI